MLKSPLTSVLKFISKKTYDPNKHICQSNVFCTFYSFCYQRTLDSATYFFLVSKMCKKVKNAKSSKFQKKSKKNVLIIKFLAMPMISIS